MQSFRAIQSKPIQKYVRYIYENPQLLGYLQASETHLENIYAQQRGEESPNLPGMANIKSIYSGKYWVPKENGPIWMVAADSDKIIEDLSSPKCTLFVIEYVDDTTVRLRHPALNLYVCLFKFEETYDNCLALFPLGEITGEKELFIPIKDDLPK
ncbi:hypothetical protein HYC85_025044 [Camellia sinensis]|uniref:Agglutinin domain-containing protein n=1 Tax=Camellia sinensis TaxID=4442 RepID=A0A7J7GDM3_CAMSI|nr:hypothetical protein HYC85_025044 [Camellia sinensis]